MTRSIFHEILRERYDPLLRSLPSVTSIHLTPTVHMSLCLRIVMKALSFLGVANSADITAANRPTLRGLPQFFFSKYIRSARTTLGVYPKNLFFPQVYKVGRVRQVYPRGLPQFFSNSSRSARSARSVATDFLLVTKKDRN